MASEVHAQSVAPASDTNPAPQSSGQEEIVVTAQKRSENVQSIPIAISAVSAATADRIGLKGTLDLQVAAPAVSISQTAGGTLTATIRGATATGGSGDESITAVYVDGQYLAGTPGLYFSLNNIERIEVLKGPQGTLFGRNAAGGAIQIITRTPQYTPSMTAEVGYANYNTVSGQFYGTAGLVADKVAIDFAGLILNQGDGWGKNVLTGEDVYKNKQIALRSKLLIEPSENTQIVVAGSYSRVELAQFQGRTTYLDRVNFGGFGAASLGGFYNIDENADSTWFSKQYTGSVNIKHDFGSVSLVSITGYEDTAFASTGDLDISRLPIAEGPLITQVKSFTQELQLISSGSSRLQWILGAYYFDSKSKYNQTILSQPAGNRSLFTVTETNQPAKSYAAFAQATFELMPGTKITGGLRYTHDEHSISGFTGNQTTQTQVTPKSIVDKKLDYRVALSQDVTKDIMLYASVSTAFKSGLFSPGAPNDPPVRPSNVTAYEVGFKSELFDRILRLNVSAYLNDYSDMQVRSRLANNAGNVFTNAATGRAKGVDVDFVLAPSKSFTLRGGLAYVDSKYLRFTTASVSVPRANGIGNSTFIGDVSGNRTILTPEFVGSLSATYTIESKVGTFDFTATGIHNSGYAFNPDGRVKNEAYDLVNLAAGWTDSSKRYSIKAFVRNLTNAQYYSSSVSTGFGDYMGVSDPRTYGFSVRVTY